MGQGNVVIGWAAILAFKFRQAKQAIPLMIDSSLVTGALVGSIHGEELTGMVQREVPRGWSSSRAATCRG